jgi:hypothetical protein
VAASEVAVIPAHIVELAADHADRRSGELVGHGRRRI